MSYSPDNINWCKNIVTYPGKFEGCHPAVPYFWGQVMDGSGESYYSSDESEDADTDLMANLFEIDPAEAEALQIGNGWFMVWEDSYGFCYGDQYNSREEAEAAFDKWRGR